MDEIGNSRSPEPDGSALPRFIAIGRVLRPHGVNGEILVEVLTDFPERFDSLDIVYLGDTSVAEPRQVRSVRWHRDRVLLLFEDCPDRNCAERLRGLMLVVPIEEVMPLPEDTYYPHQLIGLDVASTGGEDLGRISDVVFGAANDIYVVTGPRGQILLPAIADVIAEVDLEHGRMVVNLIPGLL